MFGAKYELQEDPQLIPAGELTTVPCPLTLAVTIGWAFVNVTAKKTCWLVVIDKTGKACGCPTLAHRSSMPAIAMHAIDPGSGVAVNVMEIEG